MAYVTKLLLTFKYELIARMRTGNVKAGVRSIASAQLDGQLWGTRRRRRKKRTKKKIL